MIRSPERRAQMTSNQIKYWQLKEDERSNLTNEQIKQYEAEVKKKLADLDVEKLDEAKRHNLVSEILEAIKNTSRGSKDVATALTTAVNDRSWYDHAQAIMKDAARWAFGRPLRSKQDASKMLSYNATDPTDLDDVETIPSAFGGGFRYPANMIIHWVNTLSIGEYESENGMIATAAQQLYTKIRNDNSGSTNYDKVDLMLYFLAMREGYSLHGFLTKVYSIAHDYKSSDWSYGYNLLKDLGFDADDIVENLADFRKRINTLAERLNSLHVPNTLPLYERAHFMGQFIIKDGEIKRSQYYTAIPDFIGVYQDSDGSILPQIIIGDQDFNESAYPAGYMTYQYMCDVMSSLENALINSQDLGTMSGDIGRAYKGAYYKLELISEDFHIESQYHQDTLMQINNGVVFGRVNSATLGIHQNPNNGEIFQGIQTASTGVRNQKLSTRNLQFQSLAPTSDTILLEDHSYVLFNTMTDGDEIDPLEIAEGSRLSCCFKSKLNSVVGNVINYHHEIVSCATEVITQIHIPFYDWATGNTVMYKYHGDNYLTDLWSYGFGAGNWSAIDVTHGVCSKLNLLNILAFDWAPEILLYSISASGNKGKYASFTNKDIKNFLLIGPYELDAVNSAAVQSLLGLDLNK